MPISPRQRLRKSGLPRHSAQICLLQAFLVAGLCLTPARSQDSPAPSQQGGAIALEGVAGAVAVCELSGGGTQAFELSLGARQYLRLSIEKGDLNLSATLFDPGGAKLFEYVSRRYERPEPLVVSEPAGVYRLEVRSLETEARGRRFELKVEEAGRATARDVRRFAAWAAQAEAGRLRAAWEADALRKAVDKYREARSIWVAAGDRGAAAEALVGVAEAHSALGEYRQATDLYRRAAAESRRNGDRPGELQASGQAARLDSALGNIARAQRDFKRLLDYYEQPGDDASPERKRAYAETLNNAGQLYYSKGDLLKASGYFKASLEIFSELGDRAGEARSLLYNGYVSSSTGGQDEAVARFNESLALSRATADRAGEALSLAALGAVHSLRGEEQSALDLQLEVARIFHAIGNRQSEALALNGVGQAYDDLNEKLTALDNYRQALKLFQAGGNLDFATDTVYQIAKVYASQGDSEQALAHFKQCIVLSRAAGKRRMEAYALNETAAVYASRGRRAEALGQYLRILRFHRAAGDLRGEAVTLDKVGDFYLSLGDRRKALDYYRQALPVSRDSGDRWLELSTLYSVASAERDCDDLSGAVAHVEESIKTVEALRTNIAGADLRSSYFAAVYKHYGLYVELLMRLERLRPGRGYAAAALQASETARARSLLEILGEAKADLRADADPRLLERERELQQLLRAQALYQMELAGGAQQTRPEAAEAARELRQLTAEYKALQSQLREHTPRYETLTQSRPQTLAEMQAELRGGDTILLEYALGDERSFLWAVTPDSLSSYELPARATLEEAARAVHEALTARQPVEGEPGAVYQARAAAADRAFYERAQALSDMLLGPVAEQLGEKRLIVVSEGMLQYIPFDALPLPGQPGLGGAEPALLVSRHETVSLPSLSTLAGIRQEGPRAGSADDLVAVLADPVFTGDDERVRGVVAGPQDATAGPVVRALRGFDRQQGKRGLLRLAHSSEEADAILSSAPAGTGMAVKDFAASRETATSPLLGRYRIVHFATHGIINGEHPELSGIVLSMVNRDGVPEDGFLQLHDIYRLRLSADLVVLSACETGLGKDVKGEGFVGLTRGFMYAGARSVVASLWEVDDRATARLMGHFYDAMLRDGMTPSAALRSAKESVRRQKEWRAPYFWAGFVLQGEYREKINVGRRAGSGARAVVVQFIILASVVSLIFLARRRGTRLRRPGAGSASF
jgi:CHAT domain-containing protein/tetratricopeptide (TPR) repeat protein